MIFSLAPRASISGNLLAHSDFHWPRANGPVLVSIPEKPSLGQLGQGVHVNGPQQGINGDLRLVHLTSANSQIHVMDVSVLPIKGLNKKNILIFTHLKLRLATVTYNLSA